MKTLAIISFCFIATFSNAQENLTGTWFALDGNLETPLGIEFLDNGTLNIYKVIANSNEAYTVIEGHYYYETGSDLLVTITWFGVEAKTSEYRFSLVNDQLILNQTYPEVVQTKFERENSTAGL